MTVPPQKSTSPPSRRRVLSPLAALPLDEARRNSEAITRAMRALRCADPEGGGCLYESAYDLPDWRKAY